MANLASLVKRFDPGKMLGGAISSGVGRFRSNIGSGDKGYRVMMRGYSTIKSFERRFASRDSGKSRPVGGPTRRAPSTSPSAPSGAPARTDHIAAGEEFTHKGNVYIVPEGHVFDTRSGRLIADPATSKSRSFVSFAKAGVIMQSSFDNFKTVTFRKLDKIIDLVSKLQPSPVVAAPLEEVKKPEEVGAPEKEKPSNWLPFLAGMLSGLGLRYFVQPLVQLFKRIMKWITGLWTAVRKLFTRIANAIISAFKRFWQFMSKIKDAFLRVVKFVKNLIPKAWEALKKIGKNIGEFFTKKFIAAKDFIKNRLSSVSKFLRDLGRRALITLGKAVIRMAPQLADVLKNKGGRIGDAINAAQAEIKAAAAARLKPVSMNPSQLAQELNKADGPGAKLLKSFKGAFKGGLLSIATEAAIATMEIMELDKKLKDGTITKSDHNKATGYIIVESLGSIIGSTIGQIAGWAVTKGLVAGGAAVGLALSLPTGGTAAPLFGFAGGLLGAAGGLAATLLLMAAGSYAGSQIAKFLFDYFDGDPEKLGAAVNAFFDTGSMAALEDLKVKIEDLQNGNTNSLVNLRAASLGALDKVYRNGHVKQNEYEEFRKKILQSGIEGAQARDERDRLDALAATMRGVADEYSTGAQIGERIAGDRVGLKATPRVIGGDVTPPPPAAPPPAPAPQSQSSVQPVPPQTPPAPDEQRDEFGNIVVINSQTNITSKTTVNMGPAPLVGGSTSPNPFDHPPYP